MRNVWHTPGPWMVEPINGGDTYQITTKQSRLFAVVAETPVDGSGFDSDNAHLIAAAPDLLDALESLVEWHRTDKANGALLRQLLDDADKAIAKVEGR